MYDRLRGCTAAHKHPQRARARTYVATYQGSIASLGGNSRQDLIFTILLFFNFYYNTTDACFVFWRWTRRALVYTNSLASDISPHTDRTIESSRHRTWPLRRWPMPLIAMLLDPRTLPYCFEGVIISPVKSTVGQSVALRTPRICNQAVF